MPEVAVVTDSTASIPEALIEALRIHWVPYYVNIGHEARRDLVTVTRDEFYRWLPTARELPTTASPGPGDYLTLYERLAEQGSREIISLHMTARGSGAYQAASIARSLLSELRPALQVTVIDTENVSMCQGWMAIEAARAARAGRTLGEIAGLIRRMLPVTRMIQTADTLKYLYMGGRIGRAKHLLGSLLNIRPLIGMEHGEITPLGQVRSRGQAYQAMADMIEAAVGPLAKIKIAYVHAAAAAECEAIKRLVERRLTCVESLIAELSPALGVHSGPGTAGVCYFPVLE